MDDHQRIASGDRPRSRAPRPIIQLLLPVLLILAAAVAANAQTTLRIFSPNGGENLVVDSTTQIRWLATGLTGSITIEYSTDSAATWHFIDTVPARTGLDSAAWVVPNDTTHKAFVRLTDSNHTSKSARVFNIVLHPVPTLSVLYPNGNELLKYDSTVKIRWTGTNLSGQLDVAYSIDSGATWKPISTVTAHPSGADSLTWSVPHDSTTKAFVRVRTTDSSVTDRSNRVFSIRASVNPTIKLTFPNGGEVFASDSMTKLRWTGQDLTGQVVAEYSVDSGATWKPLGQKAARSGVDSLGWKVPKDSSKKALVRVTAGGIRDTSDAVFTINGAPPPPVATLKLIYPNGGQNFTVDSVIHIRWHSENVVGQIAIRFSSNGGQTWVPVDSTTNVAGDDSITWTVPNAVTKMAMLRVGWTGNGLNDASDSVFTISARSGAGIGADEAGTTAALEALGCYPNPAASTTQIRWMQHDAGDVLLRIVDSRGRIAASVPAGHREAGLQTIEFSTAPLPAGAYLYQIIVGAHRAGGRLTVVR